MIRDPYCSRLYRKIGWNFYLALLLEGITLICDSPYVSPTISFCFTSLFNLWTGEINALVKISAQALYSFLFQPVKIGNCKIFLKDSSLQIVPIFLSHQSIRLNIFIHLYHEESLCYFFLVPFLLVFFFLFSFSN